MRAHRRTAAVTATLATLGLAACAPLPHRRGPPPVRGTAAPAAPRVNLEAQRRAYDQGVAHFGEERYPEARKAWAEALRLGPGTPIGRKAQANLQKVDAILKRLRELEAQ